jgi:hypothetical protein
MGTYAIGDGGRLERQAVPSSEELRPLEEATPEPAGSLGAGLA